MRLVLLLWTFAGCADLTAGGECGYSGGWGPERLRAPTLDWQQLRLLLWQRVVAEGGGCDRGRGLCGSCCLGALFGLRLAPAAATAATTSADPASSGRAAASATVAAVAAAAAAAGSYRRRRIWICPAAADGNGPMRRMRAVPTS